MIVVRHGEIFTKGEDVRRRFIGFLARNIKAAVPGSRVTNRRMRLFVECPDEAKALPSLCRVFGIVSVSQAREMPFAVDAVVEEAIRLSSSWKGSFAVRTQRLSKAMSPSSHEMNAIVGDAIRKENGLSVDLDSPDHAIHVEMFENKAYVYSDVVQAVGGLPLGTSGYFYVPRGDDEALLEAWMLMRRGGKAVVNGKKGFLGLWDYGCPVIEGRGKEKAVLSLDEAGLFPLCAFSDAEKKTLLEHVKSGGVPPPFDKTI